MVQNLLTPFLGCRGHSIKTFILQRRDVEIGLYVVSGNNMFQ